MAAVRIELLHLGPLQVDAVSGFGVVAQATRRKELGTVGLQQWLPALTSRTWVRKEHVEKGF